jgi:hypothetical protein
MKLYLYYASVPLRQFNGEFYLYKCVIRLVEDYCGIFYLITKITIIKHTGLYENFLKFILKNIFCVHDEYRDKWVPVTTARRVLKLRMEERPPDMKGNCDDIE